MAVNPRTALVALATLAASPLAAATAAVPPMLLGQPLDAKTPLGFVTMTKTGALMDESGALFRWISYNVPNLLMVEDRPPVVDGYPLCRRQVDDPSSGDNGMFFGDEDGRTCLVPSNGQNAWEWVLPDPWEQEDAIRTVAGAGGKVIRTYTLGIGPKYHIVGPNKFNEAAFVAMDNALAIARKYGIRLIVPFINQWTWFGDYHDLAKQRGKDGSVFFTDAQLRQDFKNIISFVLRRVNTVNGVRYGNDPTILAWQLGNELGGWDGPAPPGSWTVEMAQFIKSLAPKTLVMDGTMGGLDATKRYTSAALRSKYVDVFSNHYYYGSSDLARIATDSSYVASFGKAFVIGEFGLTDTATIESVLKATIANTKVSGAMIWSLRFHSSLGGFYTHYEKDSFWAYHAPGFPSTDGGFAPDEKAVVPLMRKYAIKTFASIGANAKVPFPVPPTPASVSGASPWALIWRGSTWAASYTVERAVSVPAPNSKGKIDVTKIKWAVISRGVLDNVAWGMPIFSDDDSDESSQYWYKITAVGVDGTASTGSLLIGPVANS
ncbi:hypothetical protein HK105_204459 [Polyrhizophydium stewartii]|uniref:mannan endo-1,4-beta-mannosidase n=1 Tax=Polyrhizophydium stewartii TaxID=2732419 RepID=A0ABR4N944_9FUNG